jgi:hypothetical protein
MNRSGADGKSLSVKTDDRIRADQAVFREKLLTLRSWIGR